MWIDSEVMLLKGLFVSESASLGVNGTVQLMDRMYSIERVVGSGLERLAMHNEGGTDARCRLAELSEGHDGGSGE